MTSASIHPSAVIEDGAKLGDGVRIGPFCHVGPDATLGDNVELIGHVTVMGATTIGEGSKVYPNAVLGAPPQNARHKGGRTTLIIGRNCTIREGVTMHTGTDTSRAETRVGDNGNFLAYTHVAHDCIIGNNVTCANGVTFAGHCEVGNNVIMGGLSAVHQFVRIGDNAFVGGMAGLAGDLIPFGMAEGNKAKLRGFNIIGMKRSGMATADIHALRRAYRMIFDTSHPMSENLAKAQAEYGHLPLAAKIIDFLTSRGKRHFCVPARDDDGDDSADDDS